MESLILPLLLHRLTRAQRSAFIEQLFPFAIGGSNSQRLAFAAITAEQQVRRAAQQDRNVIEEVVRETDLQDAAELQARFPQLHARFTALSPELQAQIFPRPPDTGLENGAAQGDRGAQPPDYVKQAPQPAQTH